ncbi:ankyrin repeat-containing domain protein [Sporodiniella umbellata]|nr:ankyrin repeat-containing domain protein [Sporodiniella umbellata]
MSVSHTKSSFRLWKKVETLIYEEKQEALRELYQDRAKVPHLVRALLASRVSCSTQYTDLTDDFQPSGTDLNALEIALLQHRQEAVAYRLLMFLKRHSTKTQLDYFLNHRWGKDNTALHLGVFRGFSRLVRLMLDLGAHPALPNRLNHCPAHYSQDPHLSALFNLPKSGSIFLKKAAMVHRPPTAPIDPHPSPLSFSSSSSSSSSSSTFSLDLWTSAPPPKELVGFDLRALQFALPTPKPKSCRQKKVRFDSRTVLMDSCVRGDRQELIECLVDVDPRRIRDVQNRSLLHIALMHGNEHLLDHLIDKVDINQRDLDGWTCLHYTAALGLWKSFGLLAALPQADLNIKTEHGLSIEDCPNSSAGKRKCKTIMDKARCT